MSLTNIVGISGILVGKNVVKGVGKTGEYVSVELTLKTDEVSEHRVKMFSNKLTKDGNISKLYESTLTIANDYKSADVVGMENADKVHITQGELGVNRYVSKTGDLVEVSQISAKFANRHENGDFTARAEFSVVGVVDSVAQKTNEEGEVELLKVKLNVPRGYNNQIEQIEIVVREPNAFEYIIDNFQKWEVVKMGGVLVNKVETVEAKTETVGFGSMPKLETKTIRTRELLATGGHVMEGMNEQQFYTQEEIQEGIKLLNQKIVEIKSKPMSQPSVQAPTGFGGAMGNTGSQVIPPKMPF